MAVAGRYGAWRPLRDPALPARIGTLTRCGERRQAIRSAWLRVGSWVGEQRADSDLDLLVDFDGPIGWQIVTLEDELSARLGIKVDLVPRRDRARIWMIVEAGGVRRRSSTTRCGHGACRDR